MVSTSTNHGRPHFMVFKHRLTGRVFVTFLKRLLPQVGRKVVLIVDEHPVHNAREAMRGIDRHTTQIEVRFLPPYAPELKPDELLNQDVKANAVGRRRATNQGDLTANVRGHRRSTQHMPHIARSCVEVQKARHAR